MALGLPSQPGPFRFGFHPSGNCGFTAITAERRLRFKLSTHICRLLLLAHLLSIVLLLRMERGDNSAKCLWILLALTFSTIYMFLASNSEHWLLRGQTCFDIYRPLMLPFLATYLRLVCPVLIGPVCPEGLCNTLCACIAMDNIYNLTNRLCLRQGTGVFWPKCLISHSFFPFGIVPWCTSQTS